jgi:hypothetical protein
VHDIVAIIREWLIDPLLLVHGTPFCGIGLVLQRRILRNRRKDEFGMKSTSMGQA